MSRLWRAAPGMLALPALAAVMAACAVAAPTVETARPTATLPDGFTLLPSFMPAYACELQNVDVYDRQMCRSERVQESVLAEGDGVRFILRETHVGTGCWGSINVDTRELRLCDVASGQVTPLGEGFISPDLAPSPDGVWYAYARMEMYRQPESDGGAFRTWVYRVRNDGTGLQLLNPAGFPPQRFGGRNLRWSADGAWVELELWDGTEDGWHRIRLKADGSGEYVEL